MGIFNIQYQEVGDIILISNKALSSKANKKAQEGFTGENVNYSHAILALASGSFYESTTYDKENKKKNFKDGVSIFCYDEMCRRLDEEYEDNWKVIRFRNLSEDQQSKIQELTYYYNKQKYSHKYFETSIDKEKKHDASFCSELVARIYNEIGVCIPSENNHIWPVHLDLLSKNVEWEDVTHEYKKDYGNYFDVDFCINLCKEGKIRRDLSTENYVRNNELVDNINEIFDSYDNAIKNEVEKIEIVKNSSREEILEIYGELIEEEDRIRNTFYKKHVKDFIFTAGEFENPTNIEIEEPSWVMKGTKIKESNMEGTLIILEETLEMNLHSHDVAIKNYYIYLKSLIVNNKSYVLLAEKIDELLEQILGDFSDEDFIKSYNELSTFDSKTDRIKSDIKSLKKMIFLAHKLTHIKNNGILTTKENSEELVKEIIKKEYSYKGLVLE